MIIDYLELNVDRNPESLIRGEYVRLYTLFETQQQSATLKQLKTSDDFVPLSERRYKSDILHGIKTIENPGSYDAVLFLRDSYSCWVVDSAEFYRRVQRIMEDCINNLP